MSKVENMIMTAFNNAVKFIKRMYHRDEKKKQESTYIFLYVLKSIVYATYYIFYPWTSDDPNYYANP